LSNYAKLQEKDILFAARKKLGLTQQQVADMAHVAISHYQKFEGGERKLTAASFWTASRILRALGLDVTTFASGGYGITEDARCGGMNP